MRFSVCFHLLIGVSSLKKVGGHLQIYSTFLFQRHVPEGKFHAAKDRCVQKYILWQISTAFYTFQHKTNRKECDLVSPLTKAKKIGERKRKTDIWDRSWNQSHFPNLNQQEIQEKKINSKYEFKYVKIITDLILKVQIRKIITTNITKEGYIYNTKIYNNKVV